MPMPPTSGVGAARQRVASGVRSSPRETRLRSSTQTASRRGGKGGESREGAHEWRG